jgi:S1-C subfamily serine protease
MISARVYTLAAIGMAVATAGPVSTANAQRPRDNGRVWVNGELIRPSDLIGNRRVRLGVTVDLRKSENDSVGATIESVTPSGPAAKAGIRSGDIITRLDGKALNMSERALRQKSEDDAEEEKSLPGLRLIELAAKLEPNDTISIEYRRGDLTKTTQLVTGNERFGPSVFTFSGPEGDIRIPGEGIGGAGPKIRQFFRGGPEGTTNWLTFGGAFADLELAPLNPDLGSYFGTSDGVLVIDAPAKSSLGLKGGDVILSVDGRKPTGPGSLLRILRTYEPGESFKLEIMRNKGRLTITSKAEVEKEDN